MTFDEILEQVIALLKRQGRVSYRALKRRFEIDDDYIEDLKEELIQALNVAMDEDGRVLVSISESEDSQISLQRPDQPELQSIIETPQTTSVEPTPSEIHASDTAERRQLTVMFVDLVDSTRLSSELDPEIYREIVREYQRSCSEVVAKYAGNVAQLLGDGLLVYFGYPQAHEDDAQRAVRSGLGIIEAIEKLNVDLEQNKSVKLAVRLGIHTGLVVVGEMGGSGRQEQLALGETPNVAARIQGIAEPNTVVISTDTYRLVEGYFYCQVSGEYSLKGLAQPITAYRVIQESEALNRLDVTAARGLTPLVGRESEMSLLLDRCEQAKSGQGQVVLLSGEAGIGKSRLIRTLRERVSTEPHNRLECRCSPYFQNTTLYPLLDLLERTLGFDRQDTSETKLQKLETALSQYRLDMDTTVPLLAFPLSIPLPEDRYPPLNMTPQRRKQRGLETFMAMMLEMAEREPLLFILEDLHWVDATTIEFLDLLIEQAPTASILAVLTCRPEFQPLWGLKSHLTPIALNRLPRHQIELMIERVTEGKHLPDEVIRHLIEKTDGVPLYVEEMTKALLESGHLKENNAGYELTQPLDTISIPATLQDSLMARLDNLDTAKGVAQLGAAIGRRFSYDLLQAVSPLSEMSLQRELDKLIEAELIYQRGVAPNLTYVFKHALIQDTAYESLLRSTRQRYHRRIAGVLEDQFPEMAATQPELLAHHYTEAGLNEQAVGYWQQAGEQAAQRSANVEAINHLTGGLDLLKTFPETPERAERELVLLTNLGPALVAAKGYASPEVEQVYAWARVLCQQAGDAPQLDSVLMGLFLYYVNRPDFQTSYELGEQFLNLANRTGDIALLLPAHMVLGVTLFWLGQFARARYHLEQGLALYDPQKHRAMTLRYGQDSGVVCHHYASWTLWVLGYPEQALAMCDAMLALAQELAHPLSLVYALSIAAAFNLFYRDGYKVQELAESAITLATEHDFPFWVANSTMRRGRALVMQGQSTEGLKQIQEGQAARQATGSEPRRPSSTVLLAEAYWQAGQVEDGLRVLIETVAIIKQTREGFYEPELYRLKGELLLSQPLGNPSEAESCFQNALEVSRRQQAKSLELRAATSLARLWQSQDKSQEAYDLLAPVYNWFTEGFDTADLIDAKALLDELEGSRS